MISLTGLYTRFLLLLIGIIYIGQHCLEPDSYVAKYALILAPIQKDKQYYRLLSSELTHGNFAHLLFNSTTLWLVGIDLERRYGTAFFAALNVMIGLLSDSMLLTFEWLVLNYSESK